MEPEGTATDEEEHRVFNIDSASGSYEYDNVETYHDESGSYSSHDDDHEDSVPRQVTEEQVAAMKDSRRLKSMGIMMGDDFDEDHSDGPGCCARYWFCWFCCLVVAVTLFLVVQGAMEYQKQAFLLYGKDPWHGDQVQEECHVYDAMTIRLIEQHMMSINDTKKFCVPEKVHECQCKHPYQASKPKDHISQWAEIATMNLALVDKYSKHGTPSPDVAILGDSITEHFNGLDLGYTGGQWKANKRVFDKLFNRENGGKINGVALGVGGDRIQNLLYRLQNGEAAKEFHPKVWWILIGTNDLVDQCNADTIVVGNIRIVEEIRKAHPGAIVVLNSILPRNEAPEDLWANPYWPIIDEINLKLECYANTASNVEFFNATDLFTYKSRGKVVVNPTLMKDPVHPNAEGTRLWGEAMIDRVIELKSLKRHRDHQKQTRKHNNYNQQRHSNNNHNYNHGH